MNNLMSDKVVRLDPIFWNPCLLVLSAHARAGGGSLLVQSEAHLFSFSLVFSEYFPSLSLVLFQLLHSARPCCCHPLAYQATGTWAGTDVSVAVTI